jgi:cell division protease FtsH
LPQEQVFLGRELGLRQKYSDAVAERIDAEVGTLLRKARDCAKKVIEVNRERLNRLVQGLLAEEMVQGAGLEQLLGGAAEDGGLAA